MAYRAHVDGAMQDALAADELQPLITLGLNHEQQHQELILTDIKHAFFANPFAAGLCANGRCPQREARSGASAVARPSGVE